MALVKVSHEIGHGRDPKREMNVNVARWLISGISDDVKLLVRAYAKPNVSAVPEGIGSPCQTHHSFIELCAFLQVLYMYRRVIKFWRLGRGAGLRKAERAEQKNSY